MPDGNVAAVMSGAVKYNIDVQTHGMMLFDLE
jgi:hypothetical protein